MVIPPIPHLINSQGMLTDNSSNPLTGSFDITFKIYDDASAGAKRWEETQAGVTVTNGLFNVILGSVTPVDLNFDQNYWLDITVGAEHMPSRLRLLSVGFAYRAWKADTANYASSVSSASHDHDADYVNVIGPDSIRTTAGSSRALKVKTYGASDADGIEISTWGSSADGIDIDTAGDAGIEMDGTVSDGVQMVNIHGDGVHMTDVAGYGIYMDDVGDDGIYINDAEGSGIHVELADHGVYIDSTRNNYDGMYVRYAEDDGVQVAHAGGDGLYVYHADNHGLYIDDSDDDGILVSSADGYGIEAHGLVRG